MEDATKLGDRLKDCREHFIDEDGKTEMSQSRLAKLTGCTRQQISSVELGKRNLSWKLAGKIGDVLGVLPEYLMGEVDYKTAREGHEFALKNTRDMFQAIDSFMAAFGYEIDYDGKYDKQVGPSSYFEKVMHDGEYLYWNGEQVYRKKHYQTDSSNVPEHPEDFRFRPSVNRFGERVLELVEPEYVTLYPIKHHGEVVMEWTWQEIEDFIKDVGEYTRFRLTRIQEAKQTDKKEDD